MKLLHLVFLFIAMPIFGAVPSYDKFFGTGGIVITTNPPTGAITIDGSGTTGGGGQGGSAVLTNLVGTVARNITNVVSLSTSNATSKPLTNSYSAGVLTIFGLEGGSGVTITPNGSNLVLAVIGSSPGGNSGAVQFNETGTFAGTNRLVYDRTNDVLHGTVFDIVTGGRATYNGSTIIFAQPGLSNYFFGGSGTTNATGAANVGVGLRALGSITSGLLDTAVGVDSQFHTTTGSNNTSMGWQSLFSNVDGSWNSGFGKYAIFDNTSGNYNSGGGYASLVRNTTGVGNSGWGFQSVHYNTSGSYNSGFGYNSLYNIIPVGGLDASYDSGFGANAGEGLTTGYGNTFLGSFSGSSFFNQPGAVIYSTGLGYGAVATTNHQVMLGTTNEFVVAPGYASIGTNAATRPLTVQPSVTGANWFQISDTNGTPRHQFGVWSGVASDYGLLTMGNVAVPNGFNGTLAGNGTTTLLMGLGTIGYYVNSAARWYMGNSAGDFFPSQSNVTSVGTTALPVKNLYVSTSIDATRQLGTAGGEGYILHAGTNSTSGITVLTNGDVRLSKSAGTSGQVWTSTDTAGSGAWAAASGGGSVAAPISSIQFNSNSTQQGSELLKYTNGMVSIGGQAVPDALLTITQAAGSTTLPYMFHAGTNLTTGVFVRTNGDFNVTGLAAVGGAITAVGNITTSGGDITVSTGDLVVSATGHKLRIGTQFDLVGTVSTYMGIGGTTAAFPALGRTNGDLIVLGGDGAFSGTSTNRLHVPGGIIVMHKPGDTTNSILFSVGTNATSGITVMSNADVRLHRGAATAGHVWTSTDTLGTGMWTNQSLLFSGHSNAIPFINGAGTALTYYDNGSSLTNAGFGFDPRTLNGPQAGYGGLLVYANDSMGLVTIGHPNPGANFSTFTTALVVSNRYDSAADFKNDMIKFDAVMVGGGLHPSSTMTRWRVWQGTGATSNTSSNDVAELTVAGKLSLVGGISLGINAGVLTNMLTTTTNLNFTSKTVGSVEDFAVYLLGAADGDECSVTPPAASILPIVGSFTAFGSNNTVWVRWTSTGTAQDPAAGTFRVVCRKFQ